MCIKTQLILSGLIQAMFIFGWHWRLNIIKTDNGGRVQMTHYKLLTFVCAELMFVILYIYAWHAYENQCRTHNDDDDNDDGSLNGKQQWLPPYSYIQNDAAWPIFDNCNKMCNFLIRLSFIIFKNAWHFPHENTKITSSRTQS